MKKLKYQPNELVYAAHSRCRCGKGLAYIKGSSPFDGYWDCSGILLGTADHGRKHTAKLPFIFYEIKEEGQPSARGATTREKDDSGQLEE